MDLFIKNIRQLIQVMEPGTGCVAGRQMSHLDIIENAWLLIKNGFIADYGRMDSCTISSPDEIDAAGKIVMPSFCDSHTHLVYSGSREQEFVDRISGLSYAEIAQKGGGINNSAIKLRKASEDELYKEALVRANEIIAQGTGAVEIKSGYGLDTESELKMLRVIRRLKETTPLTIRSTFLGAHAVPIEFTNNQNGYVDLIINDMLPKVAGENLADFIDVFCDKGFFTVENTERLLEAASRYGLRPKIHANEMDFSGGIQVGVKYGALSVDHLEYTGEAEIRALQGSSTIPTLLPGAALFLNMITPPARQMIEAGLPVALASDFNPGSSPTGNMMLILALGCINLRMLPEEAIHAVTINSACAMGVESEIGSITRGKKANLIITKPVPGYSFLPYAFGSNLIGTIILNGQIIENK
ncbi:MAG: imidazolonepropionase [Bacteroidales bacterium]|nr:imidazolonepropionase [Bacteroidales bacterium]